MSFQDGLQDVRHLEQGAVSDLAGIIAVTGVFEKLRHRAGNLAEAADNYAELALAYPLRVVTLLRQGEQITFHDDRNLARERLADAARSRLADKEVGHPHVARHFPREALYEEPVTALARPQPVCHRLVAPADKDELKVVGVVLETLGDVQHYRRTTAAKEHESGRQVGIQPAGSMLGRPVHAGDIVELRAHDHSRGGKDVVRIVAQCPRLLHSAFGTADDVFGFAVHPHVRKVCEVGDEGYERNSRKRLANGNGLVAIEVRNHRNHEIYWVLPPIIANNLDDRFVARPDDRVKDMDARCRQRRPAGADAARIDFGEGHLADLVERVIG